MSRYFRPWLVLGAIAVVLYAPRPAHAQDDVVLRAMRDELSRSMKQLQLENLDKPYFIAYRVQERTQAEVSGSFGALVSSTSAHVRFLTVEIRVGSPKLDNTNFLSMSSFGGGGLTGGFGGSAQLPLDDNYKELRRQIWLATDGAYKHALEDLSHKRAALQNKTNIEEVADFSEASPATTAEPQVVSKIDVARLEAMARTLSGMFSNQPEIYTDSANFEVDQSYTRYVNSEGTEYTRNSPMASVMVLAGTQAADGIPLKDYVAAYGHEMADLPPQQALEASVKAMGERLANLRAASLVDRYNGPVLFEGEAAAELFKQVIAPDFLATRHPVADNPQFEMLSSRLENPFQDKLGGRVLPDFMSVVDDPTVNSYQNKPLMGEAKVDDDGVLTRRTALVENGLLKTLLVTRNPVIGLDGSTGSRRGVAAAPSNLLVTVDKGFTEEALKEKLLSIVKQRGKPFGIVVEQLANPLAGDQREVMQAVMGSFLPGQGGEGGGSQLALVAFKLFPDGRQELVRNAFIDGVNPTSFKDMVAASANSTVYSTPFLSMGGSFFAILSSGGAPADTAAPLVSVVAPSMLFDDLTLKRPVGRIPKPPLSDRPIVGK